MARRFTKGRPEFDVQFEDEAELERRIRKKRRRRRVLRFLAALFVGLISSYAANWLWTMHPLTVGALSAFAAVLWNMRPL